jgi:hypothetical protein
MYWILSTVRLCPHYDHYDKSGYSSYTVIYWQLAYIIFWVLSMTAYWRHIVVSFFMSLIFKESNRALCIFSLTFIWYVDFAILGYVRFNPEDYTRTYHWFWFGICANNNRSHSLANCGWYIWINLINSITM